VSECPSCHRPLAASRPSCLYCGAPLPEEPRTAEPAAEPATATETAREPASTRSLLVLDLSGIVPERLAAALECAPYEAELTARRGGLQLHRVLEAGAAVALAARLRENGIPSFVVPEAELTVRPCHALRGERSPEGLVLRAEEGAIALRAAELLLIVTGPITRQRQASPERLKVATEPLLPGWRAHLHRIGDPRPIEIDPDNFEPGFAVSGSTRLEIEAWLSELAANVPRDNGFRDQPPALSPTEPEPKSRLSSLAALSAAGSRLAEVPRDAAAAKGRPARLDNLRQFRFYSAWRAAVERRRREAC
jgi:hypothetical protein